LQKSKDNNDTKASSYLTKKVRSAGKCTEASNCPEMDDSYSNSGHRDGRSNTPITIRYVYDIASSDTKSEQDSDPNRPVLKRNPDDGTSPQ